MGGQDGGLIHCKMIDTLPPSSVIFCVQVYCVTLTGALMNHGDIGEFVDRHEQCLDVHAGWERPKQQGPLKVKNE